MDLGGKGVAKAPLLNGATLIFVFLYLTLSGLMTHEMNIRESTVNCRINTINTKALCWVEKRGLKIQLIYRFLLVIYRRFHNKYS